MATGRTFRLWSGVLGVLSLWLDACEVTPGIPACTDMNPACAADLSATAPGDMAMQLGDMATLDLNRPAPDWTKLNPVNNPPPANAYCMAYDSIRHRVVLFGGFKQPSPPAYESSDETWEWDGTNWSQFKPPQSPPKRSHCGMAFHGKLGVVLFGGEKTGMELGDTWAWNGANWTNVASMPAPSPRHVISMVYDSARDKVVLFGGFSATAPNYLGDTWEFDGTDWAKRTPPLEPSPRYGHAMAYDLAGKRTLLYGGTGDGQTFSTEMWTWDGAQWRALSLTTRPPSYENDMTMDTTWGRAVMTVWKGVPALTLETWEFDGTDWARIMTTNTSSSRYYTSLVYDTLRRQTVLFGGRNGGNLDNFSHNDTWIYR